MRRSPARPVVAALALALRAAGGPAARAEDETTPAARFAALVKGLPAPSADHALDFRGTMLVGGQTIGSSLLKAQPTTRPDGSAAWLVDERMEMGAGAYESRARVTLDAHLQPLEGTLFARTPDEGEATHRWTRTPRGFRLETTRGEGEQATTTTTEVAHEGPSQATLTSLLLCCRMTLPAAGSYEAKAFDAQPSPGETLLETATWTTGAEGAWDGTAAWIVRGRKADKGLEAGFAKDGKALLGVRFTDSAGEVMLEIRPAGTAAPSASDDLFAAPAMSATGAAMAAALGFATGDADLLARIIHWPSVHAIYKARHDAENAGVEGVEPFPDVDELKAAILEGFADLPKRPRALIEGVLKGSAANLESEVLEGGVTRVRFPADFEDLQLDVGEVDGAWYLVRLPE